MDIKNLPKDDLPFTINLKAKINLVGKMNSKLSSQFKKILSQSQHFGDEALETLSKKGLNSVITPLAWVDQEILSPAIQEGIEDDEIVIETSGKN